MTEYGYIVFYVTTANGSVPLGNAEINISANKVHMHAKSNTDGHCRPIPFTFDSQSKPILLGSAVISLNGYIPLVLDRVIICKNVTTVRIVNLDRIL